MTEVLPPESSNGLPMRTLTHIVYGLFALGLISGGFLGLATIASIVVAYLKRGDAAGTIYAGHFDWVIKTFWWGVLWCLLSALATYIFIGWITGLVALIWIIYRIARGWLSLFSGTAPQAID
ncbi:MAG TPA: hypothetical protein VL003_00450 [Pusillimonas sp.]|uniref:DUF4870 family protein n=1 Tax=Pusillimonas sp. TaxID=3040095 RepID=UPI002C36F95B|nr:hypothetical protein [Pusillimonas sp.]HUH86506.1 hypothetical protein [Pusillimonas sp.]